MLDLPSRDVLADGRPVLVHSVSERDRRWPALAGESARHPVFAVLPLIHDGRALGVLALGWQGEEEFRDEVMAAAEEVAALCAAALERAERYRQERQARAAAEQVTERLRPGR